MNLLLLFTIQGCPTCEMYRDELLILESKENDFQFKEVRLCAETTRIFNAFGITRQPAIVSINKNTEKVLRRFNGFYGQAVLKDTLKRWGYIK